MICIFFTSASIVQRFRNEHEAPDAAKADSRANPHALLQSAGNDAEAALKETGSINKSLFTLGQVLAGLSMRRTSSFRWADVVTLQECSCSAWLGTNWHVSPKWHPIPEHNHDIRHMLWCNVSSHRWFELLACFFPPTRLHSCAKVDWRLKLL